MSIGIEDVEDLIADLDHALKVKCFTYHNYDIFIGITIKINF